MYDRTIEEKYEISKSNFDAIYKKHDIQFLSPNTILQTKTICFQYIAKSNLMADISFHIPPVEAFLL